MRAKTSPTQAACGYNYPMIKQQGTITAPVGLNIQPHELATARAIASSGMNVEFVERVRGQRAPPSNKIRVIEKRLREALHQSRDVIFDSRRMRRLENRVIQAEVEKWAHSLTSTRRLLYVNREGDVIKIK